MASPNVTAPVQPPPKKILELHTVQTSAIKTLVEALKELLTDTVVEFDETGLKIITTDTAHVILVHLRLYANKFEYYNITQKKIAIGVSCINLHKIIRAANSGDTLGMYILEDDISRLHITLSNTEKNSRSTYSLNLLDMDPSDIDIPPEQFPVVITMPSTDFQKVVRDMSAIADHCELCSVGNQLIFRCSGEFSTLETTLSDANPDASSDIVQGVFSLRHLVLFSKCTSLASNVSIFLKMSYPLVCRYSVASLGEIKLALTPQEE
jgi:proliferating cell nuclear antigen